MILFANPWMLWGLFAASLPVIIHILNRNKVKVMEWAAMQFLFDILETQKKKHKLEDLILLLLRVLLLLFLALAVARPSLKFGGLSWLGGQGVASLIIDDSYSMATENGALKRMDLGLKTLQNFMEAAPDGLAISLTLGRDKPEDVFDEFSKDRSYMLESLREHKASVWHSSAESDVRHGIKKLESSKNPSKSLFIVSDFQASQWDPVPPPVQKLLEEAKGKINIAFLPVGDALQQNAGVVSFEIVGGAVRAGQMAVFKTQVANFATEGIQQVSLDLLIDGEVAERGRVSVVAGQTTAHFFSHNINRGGEHTAEIRLEPDLNAIDNGGRIAFKAYEKLPVLILHDEVPLEEGFKETDFFEFALNPFESRSLDPRALYEFKHIQMAGVLGEVLNDYAFVVVNDVALMTGTEAQHLEDYVAKGGAVLFFLGEKVNTEVYNTNLYRDGEGLMAWPLDAEIMSPSQEGGFLQYNVDVVGHDIWKNLKQGKKNYLEPWKIYHSRTFKRQAGDKAISLLSVKKDDAEFLPSWLEVKHGIGKAFFIGLGAGIKDHNLPLTPAWPALIRQLSNLLMERIRCEISIQLGDIPKFPVPAEKESTTYLLKDPSGDIVTLSPSSKGSGYEIELNDLSKLGIYSLRNSKDADPALIVSVSQRAPEGDIRSLAPEELRALYEPFGVIVDDTVGLEDAFSAMKPLPDFSIWLLILAALAFAGENYLAHRIVQRNG